MALYTSDYLKNLSRNKTANERIKLNEQRNLTHVSFDIFLCHSYLDKEEVEGLYLELTKMGFTVYVDWIVDPQLDRNNVTKESAELVRKRLRASKTLLLAISANAALSKWMPWELGYVDGNTQLCALMPVAPGSSRITSFSRTEYLKLYPYVQKPNDLLRFKDKLWAIDSANTYVELNEWARGFNPKYQSISFF